ncbi:MAG: DUF975 family protein [Azoarcus sp.]|jgi:uncharacterized membrane protein|nr:DUF975 family protein [Azoarcus sp.]
MDHQNGNQPYTPYTPPTAETGFVPGAGDDTSFIPGGRIVPAGNAISWISDAWGLFRQQLVPWLVFGAIYLLLYIVSMYLPAIGSIFFMAVQILLTAGVIYSCDLLRRKGSFTVSDIFAGFQRKTGPLLIALLICGAFLFVLMIFVGTFVGFGAFGAVLSASGNSSAGIGAIGMGFIAGALIMFVGCIVYGMAIWFAPALILMHDIAPFEAIKMSFSACRKNLLPGIIFFPVAIVLIGISAIPFLLGLLVTMPIFFICYYTSYQDIFFDKKN